MSLKKKAIGTWGESVAENFLLRKGYQILERNYRTPYGEIDLIASHRSELQASPQVVFVEVKTRTSHEFGMPEEAIDSRKREHLAFASQYYMQSHPELGEDWRVDVISIQKEKSTDHFEIIHFEDVIRD